MSNIKNINLKILDNFSLKIIAIILMTIDHIGLFFIPEPTFAYEILRIIGRLAMPIFCFLSTQGALKSHKPIIYAIRLLIVGVLIDACMVIYDRNMYYGNALTSLSLGVFAVYFLNKRNLLSLVSIIPLSILALSSFSFFPIRMDDGLLSALLFVSFFLAQLVAEKYAEYVGKSSGFSDETIQLYKANYLQSKINILACIFMLTSYLILMLIDMYQLNQYPVENTLSFAIQSYGVLSAVFILLYNGKLGYSNKILKYSFYIYYPLHILIFYIISYFI